MEDFYNKMRNIQGFYDTLGYNGYYLPDFSSKCINGDYL